MVLSEFSETPASTLPRGGCLYRPLAPGRPRADHPWPCRSRPPRPPPLPRDRGRGAGDAPPPGPHHAPDHPLRRNPPHRRGDHQLSPRRPRAGLGPDPGRGGGRGLGRLGRLQDHPPTACRNPSSRSAATPSSPNRPSACRSTHGPTRPPSQPRSTAGGPRRATRARPRSSASTRSARHSACCACSIPPSDRS